MLDKEHHYHRRNSGAGFGGSAPDRPTCPLAQFE